MTAITTPRISSVHGLSLRDCGVGVGAAATGRRRRGLDRRRRSFGSSRRFSRRRGLGRGRFVCQRHHVLDRCLIDDGNFIAEIDDKMIGRDVDREFLAALGIAHSQLALRRLNDHLCGWLDEYRTIAARHPFAALEADVERVAGTALHDAVELRVLLSVPLNDRLANGADVGKARKRAGLST